MRARRVTTAVLAISNGDNPNQFFVFAFDDADLPFFVPQRFRRGDDDGTVMAMGITTATTTADAGSARRCAGRQTARRCGWPRSHCSIAVRAH